ncbi:aminoglycoside phosphotransferase family protein [Kribbella sp. NBC_00482]|uniref:aminoglycoside phosphotransferase family protein n=1 Tax=Kribbella sp. NBC_00482 TaxID=2975968 RepID=UPI002E17FB73
MTGSVAVDVSRVEAWAGRAVVGDVRRVRLQGGRVSPIVERVIVPVSGGVVELLAKRATPGEVVALDLLPADPVFPELVDSGVDESGPWVVTTYQPGASIGWTTEPPGAVYEALARLHQRYLGRADLELPRVDADFLRRSFDGFARGGLATVPAHPVRGRADRMLDRFVDDERLLAGLERLPVTLLHGDVHGDNVIVDDLGRPVLVDWGSARIGPPMLDVTLAAGPSGVASYGETSELGRVWATAVNNAMFVGAAAQRSLEVAGEMVIAAERAVDELGALLEIG